MTTITYQQELVIIACAECGIYFAVPKDFIKNKQEDGKDFVCPNRHKLNYPIKTYNELQEIADKLTKENADLKRDNIRLRAQLDQDEAKLEGEKNER